MRLQVQGQPELCVRICLIKQTRKEGQKGYIGVGSKSLVRIFFPLRSSSTLESHVCDLILLLLSSLEPPNSLDLNGSHSRRIKLTAPNINLSLDQSEGSILSDDNLDSPDEIDINVDDLDTPDEADSFEYTGHGKLLR